MKSEETAALYALSEATNKFYAIPDITVGDVREWEHLIDKLRDVIIERG